MGKQEGWRVQAPDTEWDCAYCYAAQDKDTYYARHGLQFCSVHCADFYDVDAKKGAVSVP